MPTRPWIEKRRNKNGTFYYVRWRDDDGKKAPPYPCGQSYQSAVTARNELEKRHFRKNLSIADPERTVLSSYKEYLQIGNRTKKLSTIKFIEAKLSPFIARYGDQRLIDISKRDIEHYKADLLKKKYALHGINMRLTALRAYFQFCVKMGYADVNPAKQVKNEEAGEVGRMLNEKEIQALLTVGCAFNSELRDILTVFLYTGMRLSEALYLERAQVRDREITIEHTRNKAKRHKIIPLHPAIKPILGKVPHGRIFTKWANPSALEYAFKRAVKRAKLTGRVRIHDLRHTAASWLLREGYMTLEEVSKFLGHTNIKTTYRFYSHFENQYLQDKLKNLSYN